MEDRQVKVKEVVRAPQEPDPDLVHGLTQFEVREVVETALVRPVLRAQHVHDPDSVRFVGVVMFDGGREVVGGSVGRRAR